MRLNRIAFLCVILSLSVNLLAVAEDPGSPRGLHEYVHMEKDAVALQMLLEALDIVRQTELQPIFTYGPEAAEFKGQRAAEASCLHSASCAFCMALGRAIEERIHSEDLKDKLREPEFDLIKAFDWNMPGRINIEGGNIVELYQMFLTIAKEEIQKIAQLHQERLAYARGQGISLAQSSQTIRLKAQMQGWQEFKPPPHGQNQHWGQIEIAGISCNHPLYGQMRKSLAANIERVQKKFDKSSFFSLMEEKKSVQFRFVLQCTKMAAKKPWAFFKKKHDMAGYVVVEAIFSNMAKSFKTDNFDILFFEESGFDEGKNMPLFDVIYDAIFWQIPRLQNEVQGGVNC